MTCYICGGTAAFWIESWGLDPTPDPYRPPLKRAARCEACMPPEADWLAEWGPGKLTVRRLAAAPEYRTMNGVDLPLCPRCEKVYADPRDGGECSCGPECPWCRVDLRRGYTPNCPLCGD